MRLLKILLSFVCVCFVGEAFAWDNVATKPWEKLENCRLVPNYGNDGDSFHVMHGDKEYIFRLCFVDCAETSMSYPQRIQDQAEWWGIHDEDVVDAGDDATKFTNKFLMNGFTVFTKYKDARGNSALGRNFAMIKVGDKYLSEELVKAGLARTYGYAVKTPDDISREVYRDRLDDIEKQAKKDRRGAWGYAKIDFFKRSKEIKAASRLTNSSKVDAPNIGGEVEGEELTLTSSVGLHYNNHSAAFRSTLASGSVIYILDKSGGSMIKVRAPYHGKMIIGLCRRHDLEPMMEE